MAKKISANNKVSATNKTQPEIAAPLLPAWVGIIFTLAFVLILSLAGSMDSAVEKWTGLLSVVAIFTLLLIRNTTTVLKNYITPLFYSFVAYVIWGGISTLYAASGKFAISEFSKLLIALLVYLAVIFFTDSNESGFKRIACLIASIGCFFGILSVDAASFGLLFKIFKSILGQFTDVFNVNIMYEPGIRIFGIFGNANTYAGFMALAVLLSIYLVIHASTKNNKRIAVSLLAINSLSYLLAFSMGSLFMFLVACLIMIGISEKGTRVSLFVLMMETAVATFIFAFISMFGLGKTGAISLMPILALILNALSLYYLDEHLRPVLFKKMDSNIKSSLKIAALIVLIIAGYTFAAFFVSSQMSLTANQTAVMRAIYVPGGEYSLSVDSSAPVNLTIESQNQYDLMRHTSLILYTGTNEQKILFKVPDNSKIVKINFSSAVDNKLFKASYSGVTEGDIHLNYPLLPSFIANRVQDLFANENLVQRTVFFQDGLKLFSKSPIIGRGLGGFENGVYSVQDFYYQTKYAHNHYVQVLSDLGIIGFALFISLLGFSVLSVIKAKRQARSLFAVPVLASCTFQIFGQALVDAVWSMSVFLAFSAAVLAAITIFCSEPIKLKESFNRNRLRIIEKTILTVFTAVFILLISGNLAAQAQAKNGIESLDEIKRFILMDRFEYNDYKLSYIVNAPKENDSKVKAQADIYANELIKVESNSLTPYIMAYDYQSYLDYDAYLAAKNGIQYIKSNPNAWINIFDTFEEYIDPVGPNVDDAADRLRNPKNYIDNVLDIYNDLLQRNKTSLDDITLSPSNNAFIGKLLEIKATNLYSTDWVFTAIMTYAFDSACAVDANQDGLPDSMTVASGSAKGKENGVISVSDGTVISLDLYHKLHGKYTFKVETDTPQGIKIAYNSQDQSVTYSKREAFVTINLADNSNMDISKFTVTFPSSAEVDSITFTTKLEE